MVGTSTTIVQPSEPCIGWFHVSYDVISNSTHHHVQEAVRYKGLRFIWTLNAITGERRSRFFIRDKEYDTLTDAIKAWRKLNPKRRVRL